MSHPKPLPALLGLVLAVSMLCGGCKGPPGWARETIDHADRMEAFWLRSEEGRGAVAKEHSFHGHELLGGPVALSGEEAMAVRGKLDEVVKIQGVGAMFDFCSFEPNFAIRYHRGDAVVDVLFCLPGHKVAFGTGDREVPVDERHGVAMYSIEYWAMRELKLTVAHHFPKEYERFRREHPTAGQSNDPWPAER